MSNILINEIDSTTYLNRDITNDNIVLVINKLAGNNSSYLDKPILLRNLRSFYEVAGEDPTGTNQMYWEYAANLIRLGFPVLYLECNSSSDMDKLISSLNDKIRYKIKFIPTIGNSDLYSKLLGIVDDSTNKTCRGDCVIFYDVLDASDDTLYNSISAIKDTSYTAVVYPEAYYESPITGNTIKMPASFWMLKTMAEGVRRGFPIYSIWAGSKRGVVTDVKQFASNISTQFMHDLDEKAGVIPMMNIPPYGDLIFGDRTRYHVGTYKTIEIAAPITEDLNFSVSENNYQITYNNAPNKKSSTVKFTVDEVDYSATDKDSVAGDAETSAMSLTPTNANLTVSINYTSGIVTVTKKAGSGPMVFSTSAEASYTHNVTRLDIVPYSGAMSALDSLNVRIAANEVKKAIFEICLGLSFETNDFILWTNFKMKLSRVLDAMKEARAVTDYLIIMDESTVTDADVDDSTVPGVVKVVFARAAKSFDITFELKPTGAVLTESI